MYLLILVVVVVEVEVQRADKKKPGKCFKGSLTQ